ncbi:MAG: hypothetical protein P8Y74_11790 [Desulfobacterales bacterium]|jgi:hypothetical protein
MPINITRRYEWLLLAALTMFGAVSFGVFYFFAFRFITPAEDVHDYYAGVIGFEDTAGPSEVVVWEEPSGAIGATLMLTRDEEVHIGETVVIYRGLASGNTFDIDVIIPAFDLQSPFHHRLSIAEARKGFTLARHSFRLLSATRSILHLERTGG